MLYEVVVGNIGTVESTTSYDEAIASFDHYVEASKSGRTSAAWEDVVLLEDGHMIQDHIGLVSCDPDEEDYAGKSLQEKANAFRVLASQLQGMLYHWADDGNLKIGLSHLVALNAIQNCIDVVDKREADGCYKTNKT